MYAKIVLDITGLVKAAERLSDKRLPQYPVDGELANAVIPANVWEVLAVSRSTNTPGRFATDVGVEVVGEKPEDNCILRATYFGAESLAPGDSVRVPEGKRAVLRVKPELAEDGKTQRTFVRRDGSTDKAWRVELTFVE